MPSNSIRHAVTKRSGPISPRSNGLTKMPCPPAYAPTAVQTGLPQMQRQFAQIVTALGEEAPKFAGCGSYLSSACADKRSCSGDLKGLAVSPIVLAARPMSAIQRISD
jgi:hypothetical protein